MVIGNGVDSTLYKKIDEIDLNRVFISVEAAQLVPSTIARRYCLIPVKAEGDKLYVAMKEPYNFIAIEDVERATGFAVVPLAASEESIERSIRQVYGPELAEKAIADYQKEYRVDLANNQSNPSPSDDIADAPIVRLINSLIEQAVNQRASDIHIEPTGKDIRVRMRIDGTLQTMMKLPWETYTAIITRIKIMGNMNIAEKRNPQDGRYQANVLGRVVDIRISTMPTVHGEKVVLRLLDRSKFLFTKEALGFSKENIIKFEELTKYPYGLILVTGPTGSGKSTTLYTMLNELNDENDNIMTIEDPVEYLIPGLNQIQVNPKAGLTFASALRSVLRQDPDVIMIGEIRDQETARMAIRAAITGHLVLSTVHTKDAAGAITRLVDMGVEPYLLADGLVGVISQRLVRKICLNCKEEYLAEESELKGTGLLQGKDRTFYRGAGCVLCNNTGYRDRIAIHEILMVTKTIREMIVNLESTDRIKRQAEKEGMKTILDQGLELVRQGITTIEEIVSLLYGID